MNAVKIHVKDLWWSLRDVTLPICRALLIGFLLVMFVWVPYQRARNVETSHDEQINKLGLETDAEINRLNTENVGLNSRKPQPVVNDEHSERIIADLRQGINERDRDILELKRLKDRAEDTANGNSHVQSQTDSRRYAPHPVRILKTWFPIVSRSDKCRLFKPSLNSTYYSSLFMPASKMDLNALRARTNDD